VTASVSVRPLVSNPRAYPACIAAEKAREQKSIRRIRAEEERLPKIQRRRAVAQARKKPDAQWKMQCEEAHESQEHQAVEELIDQLQITGEAQELGIRVTDGEVAKAVAARRAQERTSAKNPRYAESAAERPRYTAVDLTEIEKSGLLEEEVQKKIRAVGAKATKFKATAAQIKKAYNLTKQIDATPAQRQVQEITAKTEALALKDKQKMQSGRLYADIPGVVGSEQGISCQPEIILGPGKPVGLDATVCAAKKGVVSGPVKTPSGYVVFKITRVTPATQPSLAQVKHQIEQNLFMQAQSRTEIKSLAEYKAKWKALTECAAGYIVELCKEYVAP
jgi:parvulin-like peptidyl-prolyl isomerase